MAIADPPCARCGQPEAAHVGEHGLERIWLALMGCAGYAVPAAPAGGPFLRHSQPRPGGRARICRYCGASGRADKCKVCGAPYAER